MKIKYFAWIKELADKIRNELLDKGILIEDKDGKTTWMILALLSKELLILMNMKKKF